jgi:molecular chaperone HtpG
VANLAILQPTAGREALSRESIEHVHRLIGMIEAAVSDRLADNELAADRNSGFQQYVSSTGRFELAKNVTVDISPAGKSVQLGKVGEFCAGKTTHYYAGRDPSIIQTFSSPDSFLLSVSQGNPRHNIQLQYIQRFLHVPEVPDRPTIIKEFSPVELSIEEAALAVRIAATLADDYLIPTSEIRFAQISHHVNVLVEKHGETLVIYLARGSSILAPILKCYQTTHEVFIGFVKDFVRVHLYQRFAATREGAEALAKILQRNRELFRYEDSELGNLEPLLADYLAGNTTLGEVLKSAIHGARPQTVTVSRDQVGSVEQALPDVVQSPSGDDAEGKAEGKEYEASPAIMRPDVACDMKILVADKKYPQLNGFEAFLGLSDRLFKLEADYFKAPHTTRVIWASHRVIYIFGHASGRLTLYYDIELKEPLKEQKAGGVMIPTTTLFTKGRIYVPVPDQLVQDFKINEGAKEFFVRFDTIFG